MNLEQAIEQSYDELPQTNYETQVGFRKTIGLIELVRIKFNDSYQININKDIENMSVIFFDQNNGNSFSVNCSDAPDYNSKAALIQWLLEKIKNVESHFGLEFFKSSPNNPVQGKRI